MSELVLLVRHRGVDLVAMSATAALRGPCGLGGTLHALQREDAYVIGATAAPASAAAGAWEHACVDRADWFNPNKHRYALFAAKAGALEAASGEHAWPAPWLADLLGTDRRDLADRGPSGDHGGEGALQRWLALTPPHGCHARSVAAWDRRQPVGKLPQGHWPDPAAPLLRLTVWTLVLRADSAASALEAAEDAVVARSRRHGLLIHPHIQRWAWLHAPQAPRVEVLR